MIHLKDVGKKYGSNWIFRHIHAEIPAQGMVAITGKNGAGKSTLLKIIGGYVTASEGKINHQVKKDYPETHFSFAAPYQEVIDEFTLLEHLAFHGQFKRPLIPYAHMISQSGLTGSEDKFVGDFSSGMKQRLRLIFAFFFESDCLFLDEPTSNLDAEGTEWYHQLIIQSENRSIVVASNQPEEYQKAGIVIDIGDYHI